MSDLEAGCRLTSVSKQYRRRQVLEAVSFSVARGELVVLSGPSGSGKSTILNLLATLIRRDAGHVELFGAPAPAPRSRAAMELLRRRIGLLPQNLALLETDSVRANLELALTFADERGSGRPSIGPALERFGLAGYEDHRVHSLSGGEQQRVALARLLLKPCDLVLADEPTAALDTDNGASVVSAFSELRSQGKAIVVASHDDRFRDVADQVVVLGQP